MSGAGVGGTAVWGWGWGVTCSTSSVRFAGSQQRRALGDADDSSPCVSPHPPTPSTQCQDSSANWMCWAQAFLCQLWHAVLWGIPFSEELRGSWGPPAYWHECRGAHKSLGESDTVDLRWCTVRLVKATKKSNLCLNYVKNMFALKHMKTLHFFQVAYSNNTPSNFPCRAWTRK